MLFLSNDWLIEFYKTYSLAIIAIPSVVLFILKMIAIIKPTVKTNKIIDLIQEWQNKGRP